MMMANLTSRLRSVYAGLALALVGPGASEAEGARLHLVGGERGQSPGVRLIIDPESDGVRVGDYAAVLRSENVHGPYGLERIVAFCGEPIQLQPKAGASHEFFTVAPVFLSQSYALNPNGVMDDDEPDWTPTLNFQIRGTGGVGELALSVTQPGKAAPTGENTLPLAYPAIRTEQGSTTLSFSLSSLMRSHLEGGAYQVRLVRPDGEAISDAFSINLTEAIVHLYCTRAILDPPFIMNDGNAFYGSPILDPGIASFRELKARQLEVAPELAGHTDIDRMLYGGTDFSTQDARPRYKLEKGLEFAGSEEMVPDPSTVGVKFDYASERPKSLTLLVQYNMPNSPGNNLFPFRPRVNGVELVRNGLNYTRSVASSINGTQAIAAIPIPPELIQEHNRVELSHVEVRKQDGKWVVYDVTQPDSSPFLKHLGIVAAPRE